MTLPTTLDVVLTTRSTISFFTSATILFRSCANRILGFGDDTLGVLDGLLELLLADGVAGCARLFQQLGRFFVGLAKDFLITQLSVGELLLMRSALCWPSSILRRRSASILMTGPKAYLFKTQ